MEDCRCMLPAGKLLKPLYRCCKNGSDSVLASSERYRQYRSRQLDSPRRLRKSLLLDSLLRVFVLGKRFSLDSNFRVFVLGQRFSQN